MLTADINHVTTVEEFYDDIRKQQEEFHGEDYCAMHDAIRFYLMNCDSYKELGTHQGASAAAAMTGGKIPSYMELIDINHEKYRWKLKSLAVPYAKENNIELIVREADSTSLASLSHKAVDMLVIDSLHKRSHMEQELTLHGPTATKYIIAHDTTIAQDNPPDSLYRCLAEFCKANRDWKIIERGEKNVGYTVLKKN